MGTGSTAETCGGSSSILMLSKRYAEAQDVANTDREKGIEMFSQIVYSDLDSDLMQHHQSQEMQSVNQNQVQSQVQTPVTSPATSKPAPSSSSSSAEESEMVIRIKEQAILDLGQLHAKAGNSRQLADLISRIRPFLSLVSKAKAAKLVRQLVDLLLDMDQSVVTVKETVTQLSHIKESVVRECIQWAESEKRMFLKQSLQSRLVSLLFDSGKLTESLDLASGLLRELKRLDDKSFLVQVLLLESKAYHSLGNLPKAKASLTSARTTANGIYVPPAIQAALDLQSGILYAADEKDFSTAFSYFYEAFEAFDSTASAVTLSTANAAAVNLPAAVAPAAVAPAVATANAVPVINVRTKQQQAAVQALKYMLMAKVMLNDAADIESIASGKSLSPAGLKYAQEQDIIAMGAIAAACRDRSLAALDAALSKFPQQLVQDPVVKTHLHSLYDHMMEQNLVRIIEPYSRVQVSHIANLIRLPVLQVEHKLSQMILDAKINGILDQMRHQQQQQQQQTVVGVNSGTTTTEGGVLITFEDSNADTWCDEEESLVTSEDSEKKKQKEEDAKKKRVETTTTQKKKKKKKESTYESVLETMNSLSKVLDSLYNKAKRLS